MYSSQQNQVPEGSRSQNGLASDVTAQRARNQDTAHRMVLLAMRQWERALGGLIAVPSAVALTTAAAAMMVSSIVERSFELVERTAADVGRRVGSDFDAHGEPRANGRMTEPSREVSAHS